jgi:hypothetical protein
MRHPRYYVRFCAIFIPILCLFAGIRSATDQLPLATPADPGRNSRSESPARSRTAQADRMQIAENYGKLPLSFEANQGQTDARVAFFSRGNGYVLFLTPDEAVLRLRNEQASQPNDRKLSAPRHQASVLRMKLVGSNPSARVSGLDPVSGKSNYFIGNDPKKWRRNVPTYGRVEYERVYPGVDLVYYGNQSGRLEYDFNVAPGADASAITLSFAGARRTQIDRSTGDLLLQVGSDELRFHKPVVYQPARYEWCGRESDRRLVEAQYVLRSRNRVAFQIASYDRHRPLIIDPALSYSTYLGGSGADNAYNITADSSGNAFVTGVTESTDFPITAGAFQTTNKGKSAFVTKLNVNGSALIYSTYLGGTGTTFSFGIAVDNAGNAYVSGTTGSSDFPTTVGAFQTLCGGSAGGCQGNPDAFATKLDPTGSTLLYSTYLGGTGDDRGFAMALDSAGDVYVTGKTTSTDFPITTGSFQTRLKGKTNVFVAALNPTGSALLYSTYLGGGNVDQANAMAIDAAGNAFVAGSTSSGNFPTTLGAFQTHLHGPTNAFVTAVNSTGNALLYSTYLGGNKADVAWGVKVDASGSAYAAGQTMSTSFPTTTGAFQTICAGACALPNAFVAKLNPAGSALDYSTYLGGNGEQEAFALALDTAGDAFVTGRTSALDYPTTPGNFEAKTGSFSPILTEVNPSGTGLIYSTTFGGGNSDNGLAIDVTDSGNVYLAGRTYSSNFPVTPGAFKSTCKNCRTPNSDAFVTLFVPGDQIWPLSLAFGTQTVKVSSSALTTTLSNSGSTPLNITSVTFTGTNAADFTQGQNTCVGALAAGASCSIDVIFTPATIGNRAARLNVTDDAANSPQTVLLQGTGTAVQFTPPSLIFGSIAVGTQKVLPATLTNQGAKTIAIGGIKITGPNASDFSETNTCGPSLTSGASCTITVTFTPAAQGLSSAQVSVSDNGGGTPQTLPLQGKGT